MAEFRKTVTTSVTLNLAHDSRHEFFDVSDADIGEIEADLLEGSWGTAVVEIKVGVRHNSLTSITSPATSFSDEGFSGELDFSAWQWCAVEVTTADASAGIAEFHLSKRVEG